MLALAGTVALAQQSKRIEYPPELKEAFAKAKSLRFSGTRSVTFVRAGRVETHNEYVTKDGSNMRIEFAAGSPFAGQIIVETSDERKHYFPDKNEIHEFPSFGKKQFEGFPRGFRGSRGASVKFESSVGGVIAGLKCTKYQVSDSSSNPIVQIFVEPRSGMITKRVLFDQTGNIAGSFEFVNLTLEPRIQPGSFKIFRKGATVVRPIDDLKKHSASMGISALTLPKGSGYRLENSYVREINGSKVLVQSYGKEDSRITVFVTKSHMDASDLKKYNRGELASYVRTLNGLTVVLMGDQTEDQLRTLSSQISE
jgi:outer membrane lipoprotein-sorting protein